MRIDLNKIGEIMFQGELYSSEKVATLIINYAEALKNRGVKRQSIVGICMQRRPETLAAILACLYSGIIYIPIDPVNPEQRIRYMLEDCCAIFVDDETASRISPKKVVKMLNVDRLEECGRTGGTLSKENDGQTDIAYLIFTSGTTGTPKGVEISCDNLGNLIEGICDIFTISQGSRVLCFTTVGFDIFFIEGVLPLIKGATVILANESEQKNPRLMVRLIENANADIIQLTPSRAQLLCNYDKDFSCLKNIKFVLLGGEVLPKELLNHMQDCVRARIYNMYGPTETTIWSCVSDLTNATSVNIGKPIRKTEIFILNDENELVSDNEYGQIGIAGAGVAIGYHNNKELTDSRFITVKSERGLHRTYLTGDWGRRLPDGNYECVGRIDNQIKIRGFRIEPEEIENIMTEYNSIYRAIVCKGEGEFEELLGFYLSKMEENSESIKEFLAQKLPLYMIPARFIRNESFPITSSGKIDRKQLLKEYYEQKLNIQLPVNSSSNKSGGVRERVLQIIKSQFTEKLLEKDVFDGDLVGLGIDSISFISLILMLEEEFEIEFDDSVLTIQDLSNVDEIVNYIEKKQLKL